MEIRIARTLPSIYQGQVDLDFLGGTDGKESACSVGDPGSVSGSGRSPGVGNGNSFQYSCLEILWTEELVSYSPWGRKELDMTERLNTVGFTHRPTEFPCLVTVPLQSTASLSSNKGRRRGGDKCLRFASGRSPSLNSGSLYEIAFLIDFWWHFLSTSV